MDKPVRNFGCARGLSLDKTLLCVQVKGELSLKIKFVLFERTLKITVSYLSVFDSLASFLRYFSFFDMQITHMT